jgi:6-phosphogluconate dehydrogenase
MRMTKPFELAVVGMGVMGQNLARNFASRKIRTLVYNRHADKAEAVIKAHGSDYLDFRKDLKTLVQDLETPRKILLMVKDGSPVDEMIAELLPLLSEWDMIIDSGNSNYKDSIRRTQALKEIGIEFVGMGVSGGEEGALKGPSIMPAGTQETWKALSPFLEKIAAKDFKGNPCVTHIGPDGAGHYVKMIHNGIEYGVMQMMAEAYDMLKNLYGLSAPDIAEIFQTFNRGKLKSYLFEIAVPVLSRKDDLAKGFLVDSILDRAGQKGTGRWAAGDALDRGMVLPSITEAVFARSLSAMKIQRMELSKEYAKPTLKPSMKVSEFQSFLEQALYAGMISAYAQGFELMRVAAQEQKWDLDFAEIARIWEGGCIIRADLLNFIHNAFVSAKGKATHLFAIPAIREALQGHLPAWRKTVALATEAGVPTPALGTSLNYFEGMTQAVVPANFIQGLRDFFGAHTYERNDREGVFHTIWNS